MVTVSLCVLVRSQYAGFCALTLSWEPSVNEGGLLSEQWHREPSVPVNLSTSCFNAAAVKWFVPFRPAFTRLWFVFLVSFTFCRVINGHSEKARCVTWSNAWDCFHGGRSEARGSACGSRAQTCSVINDTWCETGGNNELPGPNRALSHTSAP